MEPLLATYSIVVAGALFAAWFFAFETRKTFRGGIFWNAWRIIASSVLLLMASQLAVFYQAVTEATFITDAATESFEVIATALLLVGFYQFYKAWNPRALGSGGAKS